MPEHKAYATRKKTIEDREERYVALLVAVHDTLVSKRERAEVSEGMLTRALLDRAETFDLKRLNALIASHNQYYPIEANLPIDPRTGGYLVYGRPWNPTQSWTAQRFVAQALAVVAARSR